LVDIEPTTRGLDPEKLRATIQARSDSGRLKAIVVVHLYGHPADLDAIMTMVRESGLRLIEDCAQAHGAVWRGQKIATFGDVAAFSFYPTKNLGALGDGGAVVTRDAVLAERVRQLREYGWRERYCSDTAGLNSRLDEIQAAILRAKLGALDGDNARRRVIAARYDATFARLGITGPAVRVEADHVYHQYAVCHPRRAEWQTALRAFGVGTAILYPFAIHEQRAYASTPQGVGGLAVSTQMCREVLCLPIHPQLSDENVATVVAAIETTARELKLV
jgi:dTDP-4-amino-4,6-dideoxygalactose transaminase